MLIYVKIIKKIQLLSLKKNVIYQTDGQTDRQTHIQLKTIVRNLTIYKS